MTEPDVMALRAELVSDATAEIQAIVFMLQNEGRVMRSVDYESVLRGSLLRIGDLAVAASLTISDGKQEDFLAAFKMVHGACVARTKFPHLQMGGAV